MNALLASSTSASHARRGASLLSVLLALCGCGLASFIAWRMDQSASALTERRFDRYAERLVFDIQRRLSLPLSGLKGARGVYAASKSVERDEFRAYVESRDLASEFPGILGFGFIQRVARADLEVFIANERADAAPDFLVKHVGDEPDQYITKFIYPLEPNRAAWGLNLGFEPIRRSAIERAIASGEPALTARVTLLQDAQQSPSFLLLVPVFRNGSNPHTPEERRAALVGLVYAPIKAIDLLAGLPQVADALVDCVIRDLTDPQHNDQLYPCPAVPATAAPSYSKLETIEFGGRKLGIQLSSTPALDASVAHGPALLVLITGGIISFLLAGGMWLLVTGRSRATTLATAMTAELSLAKRNADNLLRETAAFRSTIDQYNLVSITDAQGKILDVNDAFCALSGYQRSELLGKDHRLINSGHHPKSFWQDAWATIRTGKPWRAEVCNRAKNGSLYWVDSMIAPFMGGDGRPERFVSIRTDITARKLAESLLLRIAAHIPGMVFQYHLRTDGTGHFPYSSVGITAIYGFSPEEAAVSVQPIIDRIHADDRQRVIDSITASATTLTLWDCEYRYHHPNGQTIWLHGRSSPERQTDGSVLWHGFITDISAKRAAQEAFQAATSLRQAILDGADYAIIAATTDGVITVFNAGAERMLGYRADEVINRLTPAVIHVSEEVVARAAELSRELGRPIEPGFDVFVIKPREYQQSDEREWTYVRKDGSRFPVQLSVTALRDAAGTVTGYLGIANDITQRLEQQERLRKALRDAEAATQAKSTFLAAMSHEIRTPMNGVIGMANLLVQTQLTTDQREYAETIRSSGEALLSLINDILDFSKLESGKIELEHIAFSLSHLADGVLAIMAHQAEQKQFALELRLDSNLPRYFVGDPNRLRQILLNLVANAVKFTHSGRVLIDVAVRDSKEAEASLTISVIDSGIGMTPEQLKRIGQAFVQADASTTRQFGGTGLGLSITKRLLEAMGGHLEIESLAGVGSTFRVCLKLPISTTGPVSTGRRDGPYAPASATNIPPIQKLGRVLVAEDNAVNQRLAKAMLRNLAEYVDLVEHGAAAVAAAKDNRYDCILMDCQMPKMDGFEATRQIRAHERDAGRSPVRIIALTANALAGDRERCLAAGMDDYLSKPLRSADLAAALARSQPNSTPAHVLGGENSQLTATEIGEITATAQATIPGLLAEGLAAAAVDDLDRLESLAHNLKGVAMLFHQTALQKSCEQLELAIQSGDRAAVQRAMPEWQRETEAVINLLRNQPRA